MRSSGSSRARSAGSPGHGAGDPALHRHRRLDRARGRARRPRLARPACDATTRSCGASSSRFHGEERDTAGDGFFATFDGPARAIRCAQAIIDGVRDLGLEVRAGIHTGECELHDGKVAGSRSIGARVAAPAGPARCSCRRR